MWKFVLVSTKTYEDFPRKVFLAKSAIALIKRVKEGRPCPFCGGTELYYFKGKSYGLECAHCGAGLGAYKTKEEAAEAWNTRKEETFTKAEARTILNLLMLDRTGESVYESIIAKCEKILGRKD